MRGKSLDDLIDDYDRGIPQGHGKGADDIAIAFQYRVAKAQERWARVSTVIAAASVLVAIAAVIVAASK